jgi:hypothetical protein
MKRRVMPADARYDALAFVHSKAARQRDISGANLLAGGGYMDPLSGAHSLDLYRLHHQHASTARRACAQHESDRQCGGLPFESDASPMATFNASAAARHSTFHGHRQSAALDASATGAVFAFTGNHAMIGAGVHTPLTQAEADTEAALLGAGTRALRQARSLQSPASEEGTGARTGRNSTAHPPPAATSSGHPTGKTPKQRALDAVAAGSSAVIEDTLQELALALGELEEVEVGRPSPKPKSHVSRVRPGKSSRGAAPPMREPLSPPSMPMLDRGRPKPSPKDCPLSPNAPLEPSDGAEE